MAGHGSPPPDDRGSQPSRKVGRDTFPGIHSLSDADFIRQYGMIGPGGNVRTPPAVRSTAALGPKGIGPLHGPYTAKHALAGQASQAPEARRRPSNRSRS